MGALGVRHVDDSEKQRRKGGAGAKPEASELEQDERLREAAPRHEQASGSRGSRNSNTKGNTHATTGVTAPRSRPRAHVSNVGDDAATR